MSNGRIKAVYNLTPMQEGMLYHSILDKKSGTDLVQMQTLIKGKINVEVFLKSIDYLVQRHDALRVIFLYEGLDEPKQVVVNERKCKVVFEDISYLNDTQQLNAIDEFLSLDREKKMNLSKDMLFRVHMFQTKEEEYQVIFTFHHIILDGWSVGIVMDELYRIYDRLLLGETLQLGEAVCQDEYMNWLNSHKDKNESLYYWKMLLKGYQESVEIPKTYSTASMHPYIRKEQEYVLQEELVEKMSQFTQENHLTISALAHVTWGILLQKYTNQTDVVFGTVVSGRNTFVENVEKMVGLFINTIPVRITSNDETTFLDLAKSVFQQMIESEKHSYLQLAQIQVLSDLKKDLLHHVFAFENYHSEKILNDQRSYTIVKNTAHEQTNYDFSIVIIPGTRLRIKITYNQSVYDEQFIKKIGEHFENIIQRALDNPNQKVKDIEMMSKIEKETILYGFNNTSYPYSKDKLIHELFEEQVRRVPEHVAVICQENHLTYRQLNESANQVAHCIRKHMTKNSEPVAILMDRCNEMIVGIVAVLKANAYYVPFEFFQPVHRMVKEIDELHISKVIVTKNQLELLHQITQETDHIKDVFLLDATLEECKEWLKDGITYHAKDEFREQSIENLENRIQPDDRAYIIFTSGSTGNPKGVVIQHRPVVNVIEFLSRKYSINEKDRILFLTSICFDLSVYDIWGMLAAGGSIEVVPTDLLANHHYIMKQLCLGDITIWDSAPSVLQQLIPMFSEYEEMGKNSKLRRVLVGGDWIDLKLSDELKKVFPHVLVTGLGGATEATIYSNYYEIDEIDPRWVSIPYGKPIQNAWYYILDSDLKPVPIGVKGDLYIGGECLAECYINDEELTSAKFIPNPFDFKQSIMYKTGDCARWYFDGNMEFLGRNDFQVKIRGYRIETGEIEYHIKNYDGIVDTVVTVYGSFENDRILTAYYISDRSIDSKELATYLKKYLPEYMIPSFFLELKEFPLTKNGKIDRKSLPEPKSQLIHREHFAMPENDLQRKIVEIWSELLNLPKEEIGIDDNFFEIGGHSLLIIRLEVELKKKKLIDKTEEIIELGDSCTVRSIEKIIVGNNSRKGSEC